MAVTRRGYIFGAFLSGVLCVVLLIVAISSDSWTKNWTVSAELNEVVKDDRQKGVPILYSYMIVSTATAPVQAQDSSIRYGLFGGEVMLHNLATPTFNTLYMTCIPDMNACAVSCKTEYEARQQEVRALANRFRPNQACVSFTTVDESNPLDEPAVISFGLYVNVVVLLFLQLTFAVIASALAILNATKNPTEPVIGLPGCFWTNAVTAFLGTVVLMLFGIYWAVSGWQTHLAFSYIALGLFTPGPSLGFSYWILIAAIICSLINVGLIVLRSYLLERDPPPPTIKVDNHSDGTIFLY